jgi:GNAT superfamily N-acetyltransferase
MKIEAINNAAELSQKTKDAIVKCGLEAFGVGMTRSEVLEHVRGRMALVTDDSGKVISFGATETASPRARLKSADLPDTQGLYLGGIAVRKRYRRQGISERVIRALSQEMIDKRLKMLFVRTQNPAVERSITSVLEDLKQEGKIAGYSLSRRSVVQGVYGRQLAELDYMPVQSPYASLNMKRGDLFVLLFNIMHKHTV